MLWTRLIPWRSGGQNYGGNPSPCAASAAAIEAIGKRACCSVPWIMGEHLKAALCDSVHAPRRSACGYPWVWVRWLQFDCDRLWTPQHPMATLPKSVIAQALKRGPCCLLSCGNAGQRRACYGAADPRPMRFSSERGFEIFRKPPSLLRFAEDAK